MDDAVVMCRIMCAEARGLAACHLLGALAGAACPSERPPKPQARRVVYSDRFVTQVRHLTGNHRFPLKPVD